MFKKYKPYQLVALLILMSVIINIEILPISYAKGGETPVQFCRFGITIGGEFSPFNTNDLQSLRAGWYVNWKTTPSLNEPSGIKHVNVIRLTSSISSVDGYISSPSETELMTIVSNNPGQLWIIGNEPDGIWQDDLWASVYAVAYHNLYAIIKSADPTSQVGIGAIIQPTPLRFQYLNSIWDTYYTLYKQNMPIDVWNIHSFILREISADHPQANDGNPLHEIWGAFIPSGPAFAGVYEGILYEKRDIDNITLFKQRIIDFRRWMANHGQRNKPLIITEYGVLLPEWVIDEDKVAFSQTRVSNFMSQSFDILLNTTDDLIGYPYDNNRLIQQWAWFSVDDGVMGGTLFNTQSGGLRLLGQTYRDYTSSVTPTVTIAPIKTRAQLSTVTGSGSLLINKFKLSVDVANSGNISTSIPITITFFEGDEQNPGVQIGVPQVVSQALAGCGTYVTSSVTWTNVITGVNPYFVQVESGGSVPVNKSRLYGRALVPSYYVYLPLIFK